MERVLLHTCCAPCSLSCIEPLRSEGIEPVAFWYNPNIHPWKEYQARRDVLQKYAGHRKETVYQSVTMPHGEMSAVPPVPMEVMAGGAAVFIVSLDDIRKF